MLKFRILLMLTFILFCCKKEKGEGEKKVLKDYYENGTIKEEYETIDSIRHGEARLYSPDGVLEFRLNYQNGVLEGPAEHYFPNGRIRRTIHFSNDKTNGEGIEYFENGNIASKGKFFNDMPVGKHLEYFIEKSGQVKSINEYLIIKNKSLLNSYKHFDLENRLIKQSVALTFRKRVNELCIEVRGKEFDSLRAIVCKYDRFFNLQDSANCDTVYTEGDSKNSMIRLPYLQGDTIRGYVENYGRFDRERRISKDIYFSYPSQW